jgi:hypothetical protein
VVTTRKKPLRLTDDQRITLCTLVAAEVAGDEDQLAYWQNKPLDPPHWQHGVKTEEERQGYIARWQQYLDRDMRLLRALTPYDGAAEHALGYARKRLAEKKADGR